MKIIFADDSRQANPSRDRVGELVAIGGIIVPSENVRGLERNINGFCAEFDLSSNDSFKWSPGRDLRFHRTVVNSNRREFYRQIITSAQEFHVEAIVVIEDTNRRPAIENTRPDLDVTKMFIERIEMILGRMGSDGIIIIDRPQGGTGDRTSFLNQCFETIQNGTDYVLPEQIAINVVSSPAKFVRLIQLADVVTSCAVARVAGEEDFSPLIFSFVKELLVKSDRVTIGGFGLKIHPDYVFRNLYHWLCGDVSFIDDGEEITLPDSRRPYCSDERVW